MPSPQSDHHSAGSRTAAISNLVVRLMSEYTGRGPTRARTYMHDDLVAVLLADTLTKGERRLASDGQSERVLSMRKAFQTTMRDDLVAGIEEITGRKVVAFMSDNHIEPDMALEAFVLEPESASSPAADAPSP